MKTVEYRGRSVATSVCGMDIPECTYDVTS